MSGRVWNVGDPEPSDCPAEPNDLLGRLQKSINDARRERASRMSEPIPRTWDMGDTIPADVLSVHDGTDDDCTESSPSWGRTYAHGEWKGYKEGGKRYEDEAGLLRRWGPVTEALRVGDTP